MDNSLISRLIKKINFDLADKFELSVAKDLSFVPINMQNDVFFVAIHSKSNKAEITKYVNSILNNKLEFIYLNKDKFDMLFDAFLKKFSAKYGTTLPSEEPSKEDEEDVDYYSGDLELDEDFNLDDQEDLDISDEADSDSLDIADDSDDVDSSDDGDIDVDFDDNFDDKDDLFGEDDKTQDEQSSKPEEKSEKKGNIIDFENEGVAKADISKVKAPQTKKLGEILIEENLINEEQLEIALAESKVQKIPLGSVLVKMGFVTIKDLKEALGAQMGLKYATAEQLKALPTAISILPEDFVKINKVIPLSMTEKSLVVGMVNPNDTKVINEIVYQTGLKPTIMLVTHVEFENFLNTYYNVDKSDTE